MQHATCNWQYALNHQSPSNLAYVCWCLWASTSMACILMPNMTSINTVTQWREDWSSAFMIKHTSVTDPTIQQPGFDLPHHTWSLMNYFRTGQGPCHANLHKWGLARTKHEPRCRHVPINKVWRWTESAPRSGWWCRHMAGIYSDCSSGELINMIRIASVMKLFTEASSTLVMNGIRWISCWLTV